MWLTLTLIAGILATLQSLISRHVLKGEKDAWAYSFFYSAVGALVSFPFMLFSPKLPASLPAWGIAVLIGALIVLHNWFVFKSSNTLEASLGGALSKFRLIWVFLIGILLLHEVFSMYKLIGMLVTILAGLFVIRKFQQPKKIRGIIYVLISTLLNATIIYLYKLSFAYFNVFSMTFFAAFLIPTILNFIVMPKAVQRIASLAKSDGKLIYLATALGGIGNIVINQSFAIGEVSRVTVISEAFVIVTLMLEHVYFRERSHLGTKTIAVILAVLGALFITIG